VKTQSGKRKEKNRGEGTTGEKYYKEGGDIGREERF
jgi:hypothetical protein